MYKVYGGLSLSLCWIEWPWNKLAMMHVHCHFHRLSTSTNQIHCGTLTYASGKTDLLRRIGYRSFISSALTSVSSASCVNTYLSIITTISSTKRCFFVQEVFIVFDKNIYIYTLPAWFTLHVQLLVALRLSSPKFSPTIPHHESKEWFKTWTTHRFTVLNNVFFCFFRLSFAASIVSSTAGESTDLPKRVAESGTKGNRSQSLAVLMKKIRLTTSDVSKKTHSHSTFEHSETWPVEECRVYRSVRVRGSWFEVHPIQYPSIAVTPFRWGAIRSPPLSTKRFSSLPRRSCTSAFQRWLLRVGGWWYSSSQLMVNWPKWKI